MIYRVLSGDDFAESELVEVFNRLSGAQKNYIKRKNEKSAKQSLAARALLCRLLTEYCPEDLARDISSDQKGRLYVDGRPDIFVSISHSRDMVAAAVSDKPVGVDVEYIRTVSEKLKKRVCREMPETQDDFFKVWTLKEAYLKASGIPFSKMLSLSVKCINESVQVFTQEKLGYYITIVEME